MAKKRLGDRIKSNRFDKRAGRWRLRYVLDGKEREEHFGSKGESNARADVIRDRIAAAAQTQAAQGPQATGAIQLGKGSLQDWRNLLWWQALQIVRRPADEDLQRSGRALATLAGEARKNHKTDESEEVRQDEIAQMSDEELMKEMGRLTCLSGGLDTPSAQRAAAEVEEKAAEGEG